jgi:tRNA(Ile)-lysidine synthase
LSLLSSEKLGSFHNKKLLLAFSGGADSSALFFTLLEHKIPFDIAIVHYGLREQADEEVKYAQELAATHSLQCHLHKADKIGQNFEYEARHIRYTFFERLIQTHGYTHLLTAHHLQDRLEWLLMQLCKGAGVAELVGMQENEQRIGYTLCRPLIETSKEEIISYLEQAQMRWFHDESNDDLSYKRNYFRHEVATKLLQEYSTGIKQSFKYLQEDAKALIKEVKIHEADELSLFVSTKHKRSDIYHIDKVLKARGYILTAQQREELKTQDEIIAGRKYLVVLDRGIYYIAPYLTEVMDKDFKEECRGLGVPVKLRPYLFKSPLAFILFTRFLPCSL